MNRTKMSCGCVRDAFEKNSFHMIEKYVLSAKRVKREM